MLFIKCVRIASGLTAAFALSTATPSKAAMYPPGTFSIDGIPLSCGNVTTVVDLELSDVGMSGAGLILINPSYLEGLPTSLRLWWFAHECAHHVVGPNELAADCWSVRKGRDEGWFSPAMFRPMTEMFAENGGDSEHASGPERVRNMIACYTS